MLNSFGAVSHFAFQKCNFPRRAGQPREKEKSASHHLGLLRHTLAEVGCEALFSRGTKAGAVKTEQTIGMDDEKVMELIFFCLHL